MAYGSLHLLTAWGVVAERGPDVSLNQARGGDTDRQIWEAVFHGVLRHVRLERSQDGNGVFQRDGAGHCGAVGLNLAA